MEFYKFVFAQSTQREISSSMLRERIFNEVIFAILRKMTTKAIEYNLR